MNDLRIEKRRRTNNAGTIQSGDKQFTVLLRDVSPTGARIRVVSGGELPARFHLVARMDKLDADCIVVWRRGNDYGLHFETGMPLAP